MGCPRPKTRITSRPRAIASMKSGLLSRRATSPPGAGTCFARPPHC